tara:strand:+ start:76 stop:357 length:282 start_codon:yes stop_codon:yes gene_type:complete
MVVVMVVLIHHYLMGNQVDLVVAVDHILDQVVVVLQLVAGALVVMVQLVLILRRLEVAAVVLDLLVLENRVLLDHQLDLMVVMDHNILNLKAL